MTVGGWYDAEDLYGPLNTYKGIEKSKSGNFNMLVMGPWSHGDWARDNDEQRVGNVYFGKGISDYFKFNIEREFFKSILKDEETPELPEAYLYDTGEKEWRQFAQWPPQQAESRELYLAGNEALKGQQPKSKKAHATFISDPHKPVPYTEDVKFVFTPRKYMTDDQRFAARRPDVLVFETEVLDSATTLVGGIDVDLWVSTTGTDADWIVKVVDVFPADAETNEEHVQDHLKMSNYHMMVRSEVMRGRFRNSFEKPQPFSPGKSTLVKLHLQDVCHTFQPGHKIQIQVQSTWFPLIDRNPQTFVPNIYKAKDSDYKKQTHKVYFTQKYPSKVKFSTLK